MESEFAQGDLGFERYPRKKKAKKNQKDFFRQSVHTDTIQSLDVSTEPIKGNGNYKKKRKKVMFDVCDCNDEMQNYRDRIKNSKLKTWQSITKLYGDKDTTEVWIDDENHVAKVHKGKYKSEQNNNDVNANENIDYNKNRKKRDKNNIETQNNNKNNYKNNVSVNPDQNTNGTSVISLFRNSKNKQKITNKTLKIEKKSKYKRDLQSYNKNTFSTDHKIEPLEIKCSEGPCAEAKMENKRFFCRCVAKKKESESPAKECTNVTCKISRNSLSLHNAVKIKNKILCLCQKYSQKIINLKEIKRNKYDFDCKCNKKNFIECSENTCGKYTTPNMNVTEFEKPDQAAPKSNLQTKQKQKLSNNKHRHIIKLEHENEQTGEPFFEVQVNPRDMCVLNPKEIRENIIRYGQRRKQELKCICPSRGRMTVGDICQSGVCKKAYKNKQTNFNCWCEKKVTQCGDTTCDFQGFENRSKKQNMKITRNHTIIKPLLEVQLNMDKMCVVNPKEIEDKMINKISVDDICSSGACRDAALKHKVPYFCKCISKKMNSEIKECKEDTCIDTSKRKRSKFCLLCTKICSRSENWSSRKGNYSQKRTKRSSFYELSPNKICRGKICSKSDNLRGNGFYINDVKHLPTCNCKECKENIKSSYIQKVKRINNPENTFKLTTNKNNKYKYNDNTGNNISDLRPHKVEKKIITIGKVKNKNEMFKTDIREHVTCTCAHACECRTNDGAKESKKIKDTENDRKKKIAQKKRNKKNSQHQFLKDMKRRAKLDKEKELKAAKLRMKEIKQMKKKMEEEPLDTNCFTAFFLGILKITLRSVVFVFSIIITIIKDPKGSFWYIRDRLADPEGTCNKLRKWFNDALMIKKLQISETVRGSDTLTILADHFLDTPFYQSFADKGGTKKDQMEFERKSKARKRRIRKREQQAIASCRHMLLTTLRQTPCLWVYHICPNFYPQCLSLLSFMRNFCHILMFLAAFICWTPCIVSFELCRAVMCCFMCTN